MPLETGSVISDLVVTNPAHTDSLSQADAHIRLLKAVLKTTFPNIDDVVNLTADQLNVLVTRLSLAAEPTLGFERTAAGILTLVGGVLRGNGLKAPGEIFLHAGATAPTGSLACDGTSLATVDQPALFDAIGYTWGGAGANFNIPNFKNRYLRHRDAAGLAGAVGTLQAELIGAHLHALSITSGTESADHTHSGTTATQSANHTHLYQRARQGDQAGFGASSGQFMHSGYDWVSTESESAAHAHTFTTGGRSAAHTHLVAGNTLTTGTGIGAENRPLSATVLVCIKL